MARTAPVPDIPPIPGMNPGTVIAGGGGGGPGDGDGDGASGEGNAGANTENGGDQAGGDGTGAGNCGAGGKGSCPNCHAHAHAGDPVDVATGVMFTIPHDDLTLPGAIELTIQRRYSTAHRDTDVGLGFGWSHTFSWGLRIQGANVEVRAPYGALVLFDLPPVGQTRLGTGGWVIHRTARGFLLDTNDGFTQDFIEVLPGIFRLLGVRHRNRSQFALYYDLFGRLVTIFDSVGRMIRVDRHRDGHIAMFSVANPRDGRALVFARYAYDEAGDLVAFADADGHVTRFTYDDDHKIVHYSYPTGLTFHFLYDKRGRCVETWGDYPGKDDPALDTDLPRTLRDGTTRAKGIYHTKITFGANGFSEVVDTVRLQRYYSRPDGRMRKAVSANGVTTRTFDADGNMTSLTDASGETTTYEWDLRGRLTSETDPLGRTLTIVRDASGMVIKNVDYDGKTVICDRDAYGNPVRVIDQKRRVTSYAYDDQGQMTERVDPNGAVTRYKIDGHCNMVAKIDPDGARWRWAYDYWGRPIERTDPLGGVTRYRYSDAGRLTSVEKVGGDRVDYRYDGLGNVIALATRAGTTHFTWGGLRWFCEAVGPNGDSVRRAYNYEGWLVKDVNERGEIASYKHDLDGMVIEARRFDGNVLRRRFDPMHRLVREEDARGYSYEITRDGVGRDVAIQNWDGTTDSFEYDAKDRVVATTGPGYRLLFTYDEIGNLVHEEQIVDGEAHRIDCAFDSMNGLVSVRTSLGHTIETTRDNVEYPVTRLLDGEEVVREERNAIGFLRRRSLASGTSIDSEYDGNYRLMRRRVSSPTLQPAASRGGEPEWMGPTPTPAIVEKAFHFDPASGALTARWDAGRGSTAYRYDARKRLVERAADGQPREAFAYDKTSNLFEAGAPREYAAGNVLTRRGDALYLVDAAGFLVEKRRARAGGGGEDVWRYTWNGRNQLAAVELPDGTQVEFLYDAFNRRLEKRVTGRAADGSPVPVSLTRFVWRADRMVHEVTRRFASSGETRFERTYCFGDGDFVPFAHRDAWDDGSGVRRSEWFYYVGDVLDTPEELVGSDGAVACSLERSAWGLTSQKPNGRTSTPFRFEGQYHDEETGLSYNLCRYYDPELGRYISPDPLGVLSGNLNLFAYCTNPIEYVDPFGLHDLDVKVFPRGSNDPVSPPATAGHPPGGFRSGWTTDQTDADGNRLVKNIPGTNTPTSLQSQQQSHTERQAIEWMRNHPQFQPTDKRGGPLDGGRVQMGGQLPPCPMCSNQMRQFAKESGAAVHYSWPTGNRIAYDPSAPNDSPKNVDPTNPRATAFCADYAPNGSGPNTPTARYRGEQDHMRRQGTHPDNAAAAAGDTSRDQNGQTAADRIAAAQAQPPAQRM